MACKFSAGVKMRRYHLILLLKMHPAWVLDCYIGAMIV